MSPSEYRWQGCHCRSPVRSTRQPSGLSGCADARLQTGSIRVFLQTSKGTRIIRVAPHATLQEAVDHIGLENPAGTWKAHCQAKCIHPNDPLNLHNIRDQDCITIAVRERWEKILAGGKTVRCSDCKLVGF